METEGRGTAAVSPVIAVILMVAIAVVLAAVVFVLTADVQEAESAPAFSVKTDDQADHLDVVSAAQGADWNRLAITADQTTIMWGTQATLTWGNITTANAFSDITTTNKPMHASDYIYLCGKNAANTAAEAKTDVKIKLRDEPANQLLGEWTFLTIRGCGT